MNIFFDGIWGNLPELLFSFDRTLNWGLDWNIYCFNIYPTNSIGIQLSFIGILALLLVFCSIRIVNRNKKYHPGRIKEASHHRVKGRFEMYEE